LITQINVVNANNEMRKDELDRANNSQPFALLTNIEKMALELDGCFEEDPGISPAHVPRTPLAKCEINLTAAATLKELRAKGEFLKLQTYLNEVDKSVKEMETSKLETRAKRQLDLVKNAKGELDTLTKEIVPRFKSIEASELCRRIDNRWIPIYKAENVSKKD
ncbi:MAG: hypothetical protein JWM11_7710, partial [Planctomycetaceae bacterium]|nr:hypothetical protein [Planctomycetaceae bacterium]